MNQASASSTIQTQLILQLKVSITAGAPVLIRVPHNPEPSCWINVRFIIEIAALLFVCPLYICCVYGPRLSRCVTTKPA
jgi:hypothetical protein